MREHFEVKTRENGEAYYSLSDDRPDWLYDAVRDAHDDELPNDWRYETCYVIAEAIDDGADDAGVIADSLVDVYTADLLEWLAGHVERAGYADRAAEDGLVGSDADLVRRITVGQFVCVEQMAQVMLDAYNENEESDYG